MLTLYLNNIHLQNLNTITIYIFRYISEKELIFDQSQEIKKIRNNLEKVKTVNKKIKEEQEYVVNKLRIEVSNKIYYYINL